MPDASRESKALYPPFARKPERSKRSKASSGLASALTLIELLFFLGLIGSGIAGIALQRKGWGGFRAWWMGGLAGCAAWFLGVLAAALLIDFGIKGVPRIPRCRHGCCRGPGMLFGHGNYEFGKFGDEYNQVCRMHGVRYQRRGKRFVIMNDDGTESPYLIYRSFRGWAADHSVPERSSVDPKSQ